MTCKTCKHWKGGDLTRYGFSRCLLGKPWQFWPAQHTCGAFTQEATEPLAIRLEWLRKRGVE